MQGTILSSTIFYTSILLESVFNDTIRAMIKVSIKEMAEKRGITTSYQLMKATGVQPSQAAKWYRNDLKSIGIDTLDLLCEALDCEPSDLLVRVSAKKSSKK